MLLLLWTAWCWHHGCMEVIVEGGSDGCPAWLTVSTWNLRVGSHPNLFANSSCPFFLLMTSTLNPQGSIHSFIILLIIRRFFLVHGGRENSQNSMICTEASSRPCMLDLIFLPLLTLSSHSSLPYRVQHCWLFHFLCPSSVSPSIILIVTSLPNHSNTKSGI